MAQRFRIKKGDTVIVRTGVDKNKSGEVLRVLREKNRVVVQGINMVKKHQKQTPQSPGGIIEMEASIHISNVALVDPESQKATRVGVVVKDDGAKVRVAKRSGKEIEG